MQFWYILNPYGNREKIEGRIIYVFLKLVYDPYWDGTQESMNQMIEEAKQLILDVKALQREQELACSLKTNDSITCNDLVEVKDQIEGVWEVDDVIREMYSLSDRFIDYKYGMVQLPSNKQYYKNLQENKELTFKPRINKISQEIEKRNWQFRMQVEREERQKE